MERRLERSQSMSTLSAIEALNPAMKRTQAMLLRPFRFLTWLKMGLIGWLAGELVGLNFNFQVPAFPGQGIHVPSAPGGGMHWPSSQLLVLAILVGIVGLAMAMVFLYLFSRFRFILFDAVLSGQPGIRRAW